MVELTAAHTSFHSRYENSPVFSPESRLRYLGIKIHTGTPDIEPCPGFWCSDGCPKSKATCSSKNATTTISRGHPGSFGHLLPHACAAKTGSEAHVKLSADFRITFAGQDAPVSMSFASLLCCGTHQLGRTTVISRGPTGSFVSVANHYEPTLPVDLVLAAPARRWRITGYRRTLYPPLPIAPTNGAGSSIEQKYTVDLPKLALIVELTGIAVEIGRFPAGSPCDRPPNPLAGKSRRTHQKAAKCNHQCTTDQHFRFHIQLLGTKLSTD